MSRILVVDDDPDIRLLLRVELGADGHQIAEAADGARALAHLAEAETDLVLLDMMMPGIDGWEVLRRIDVAEAPPIIVITALSTDRDRHVAEVLELGALEVVSKPFDPGWLVRLANAVLLVEPDERAEYRRRRLEAARHR
ncbi:MAG TPA: response regulator [Acidimicrobiales bacterium]